MIGLDTNVLVRYLAQDDPVQGAAAARLIDEELTPARPGFITLVVLVETCWVLKRLYAATADELITTVADLLNEPHLRIERHDVVRRTLQRLQDGRSRRSGRVGLADGLIAQIALDEGCSHTVTFDRAAARWPGMKLVASPPRR